MTLRQYTALLTRWQEGQARQDRRTQQVVWMLAEINRDRQSHPQPFALDDFALHRWPLVEGQPRASPAPQEQTAAPERDASADAPRGVADLSDEQQLWAEIGRMRQAVIGRYGAEAGVIHGDQASEALAHLNGERHDG